MSLVSKLLAPFQVALKHPLESFIRLETADDEFTMVSIDGSLLSFIKVEGCRTIIGEQEYKNIIEGATIKIGSKFDRQGHALQVFFVRDPDRTIRQIEHFVKPTKPKKSPKTPRKEKP